MNSWIFGPIDFKMKGIILMINKQQLTQFLIDSSNAGYAGGKEKQWIKEKDGSTTIPFEKEDWKSHDNFFGGEPYGGRVVVFYKNKPIWMMVYYGWVKDGVETGPVYHILQGALKLMPEEAPFRGPKEHQQNKMVYKNTWQGDVERFSGEEIISSEGKITYQANYMGGWVDQRKDS